MFDSTRKFTAEYSNEKVKFLKGDLRPKVQLLLKMILFHHKTKCHQQKIPKYTAQLAYLCLFACMRSLTSRLV